MKPDKIHIEPFQESDITFWRTWEVNTDFSQYQTYLLPENYDTDNNEDYQIFMICSDSVKKGAIWLEKIDLLKKAACIGLFIGDSKCWGKGIGSQSIYLILDIAFRKMNLDYVWLHVRETNSRAIRCYEKIGFKTIKQCGPKYFADGSFQHWYEIIISKSNCSKCDI